MEVTEERTGLPPVLVPVRQRLPAAQSPGQGLLFHDLSLTELIRLSAQAAQPQVVDVDTVEGLAADGAALAFLSERLGIRTVITRRPALAQRARELGVLALLKVHCLDSTGLERSLETHPGAGVGTALAPGLILAHLSGEERMMLPEPVLAYGLLRRPGEVKAAWAAGAAAVVTEAAAGARSP